MWLKDLDMLYKEYCKYNNDRIVRSKGIGAKIKKKGKNSFIVTIQRFKESICENSDATFLEMYTVR